MQGKYHKTIIKYYLREIIPRIIHTLNFVTLV
jgi:hypothetical protein